MTVIVTVVFAILQGVQDTLDDPFDGLSEDDINLEVYFTLLPIFPKKEKIRWPQVHLSISKVYFS